MTTVKGYAAQSADSHFQPFGFDRHPHDIQIDIRYCGACHSDLNHARNDWGNSLDPMVPGHKIAGRVARVSADGCESHQSLEARRHDGLAGALTALNLLMGLM